MIDELIQILLFVAWLPVGVGWIWGFHCLFSEGYIFEELGKWLNDKLPDWICDPLFACQMCMASVHGSLIFFLFIRYHIQWWPLFCVSLCGLNFIINKLTDKHVKLD